MTTLILPKRSGVRTMIFAGFYRATTAPQPMTYPEVVNYIWLGQKM